MKKILCTVAMMSVVGAANIYALNSNFTGKSRSVSVAWRYSDLGWGDYNPACPENNMYSWCERGSIVKFNIENNNVSCDTIYYKKDGMAQYPAFNVEGNKVVFYRWGAKVVTTPTGNVVQNGGTTCHISVINIDGSGLRDLCALPYEPSQECALDWPAGSTVYYVLPKTGNALYNREGIEVWRVDVGSGATSRVCTLGSGTNWIRRFSLNLTANRASIQGINFGNNVNSAMCFPPTNCNVNSCNLGYAGSCNTSLSASGCYVAGYLGGWHQELGMSKIDGSGPAASNVALGEIQTWTDKRINGVLIDGGAEVIRWGANSDKWVCQQFGWHGHADGIKHGLNQVIANWVDKKGIVPSSNPKIPMDNDRTGVVFYNNGVGDFWLDGGQANFGKYQDANGAWQSIGGFTPSGSYIPVVVSTRSAPSGQAFSMPQLSARCNTAGLLEVSLFAPGRSALRIADMSGRMVFSRAGLSALSIPAGMFEPGVYLISERSANRSESIKVSIAR